MSRTKVAIGSVVGAVALHVAMVACGGGVQPTGDGGVLDALADAARDVLDAETRDAHAGGDGGVPACNCVEPPSFSFSGGALMRDGQPPQEPVADFSTATVGASPQRGADGSLAVSVGFGVNYYFADGGRVTVTCNVRLRPDGSVIVQTANGASFDARCQAFGYSGPTGSTGAPAQRMGDEFALSGLRVTGLTGSSMTLALPAIPMQFASPSGSGTLAPITIRASVPGASWLTPPRALRP